MSKETCFVVMPIGEQNTSSGIITEEELRAKYDNLIKEALLKARPGLEVTRSDDIATQGTITTDIIMRIMNSTFVVADITYPNPNVFYELGLRHACRPGTIIIKDKSVSGIAFDIAHLRHIPYSHDLDGLQELSKRLKDYFIAYERDPKRPDNHLLEIARLTKYSFQDYSEEEKAAPETQIMMELLNSPSMLDLILRQQSGEDVDEKELFKAVLQNPNIARPFIESMVNSGDISFLKQSGTSKPSAIRKRKAQK